MWMRTPSLHTKKSFFSLSFSVSPSFSLFISFPPTSMCCVVFVLVCVCVCERERERERASERERERERVSERERETKKEFLGKVSEVWMGLAMGLGE